jgi:flagella basal body P-ring formation protein FlgA
MKKRISVLLAACAMSFSFAAFAGESTVPDTSAPQYHFRLTYEDTEEAVSQALAEKGAGQKVAAKINGNREGALFSYDKPISAEIRGLRFDKNSSHWSANILFIADEAVISAMPVAGKFEEVAEVPVLKRGIRTGEVISQDDIEYRTFAVKRMRQGTVFDAAALIEHAPVRIISAGRPIREEEIAKPTVVKKNAVVQMHYNNGGVQISTKGIAMTDGGQDQMIAVRNLGSNKTVYAVVKNTNEVQVKSSNMRQAANSQLRAEAQHEAH